MSAPQDDTICPLGRFLLFCFTDSAVKEFENYYMRQKCRLNNKSKVEESL